MRSDSLLTLRSESLPLKRIESIESSMPDTQINEKLAHSSPAEELVVKRNAPRWIKKLKQFGYLEKNQIK